MSEANTMTPEETLDWLAQQHFDQCREERPIQDWIRKMKSQLPAQPAVAEQHKQEPVATLDDLEQEIYENTRQFVSRDVMEWMLKRYYTTPPQRTWVGLTDRDIEAVWGEDVSLMYSGHYDAIREVEAKLKEKNNGA